MPTRITLGPLSVDITSRRQRLFRTLDHTYCALEPTTTVPLTIIFCGPSTHRILVPKDNRYDQLSVAGGKSILQLTLDCFPVSEHKQLEGQPCELIDDSGRVIRTYLWDKLSEQWKHLLIQSACGSTTFPSGQTLRFVALDLSDEKWFAGRLNNEQIRVSTNRRFRLNGIRCCGTHLSSDGRWQLNQFDAQEVVNQVFGTLSYMTIHEEKA